MLDNNKRKSLGRGLGALLGDDDEMDFNDIEAKVSGSAKQVDISSIQPSKYQPRTEFDRGALEDLSRSISRQGVLQPLLVRRTGSTFELIAGERRLRAAKMAGLKEVPVIEKDFSDQEVLEVALVENLLRENLSAIEEAEGFQRLMDEFAHCQENVAEMVGKSRSHVANTLRLLKLPDFVKSLIREGNLSAGHARQLVGLDNAEMLAKQIIEKDLSVRAVEDLVSKQKNPKLKEPKQPKDFDIAEIEKDLVKSLGLRIKINPSKQGGGKVVLQYASVAELDMIVDILEGTKKTAASNAVFKAEAPAPVAANNEKFTMKVIG